MSKLEKHYRPRQLAKLLSIGERQVYEALRKRELRHRMTESNHKLIPESAALEWFERLTRPIPKAEDARRALRAERDLRTGRRPRSSSGSSGRRSDRASD